MNIVRVLFLFLLFYFWINPVLEPAAAEYDTVPSLTEEQKMEQIRSYFQSEYQEEDYFRTDRLLLTATRHLMEARNAPAIASVVTAEEIRNMGAMNLLDILQRLPGIGVTRNYYSVYLIEIRGLTSTRNDAVKLMVDGHVIKNPTLGGASWAWDNLSLEQFKRVEVIRGPGSALYGANALSGIINVVSKTGDAVDGTQVSVGGGSYDSKRINILHGRQYGTADVLASLTYYDVASADLFIASDVIGQSGVTDDWAESWDASLRISWHDFIISGKYMRRRNGPFIGVANALNDESLLEIDQYFVDLLYARALNDKWNINARAYYDLVDMNFKWEIFPEGFISLPPGMAPPPPLNIVDFTFPDGMLGTPHFKDRIYGLDLGMDYQINDSNKITLGFVYEEVDHYDVTHHANFDPNYYIYLGSYQDITSWANWNKDFKREIMAVYIQDEWRLLENLRLTAGVRFDDYNDVGDSTNPRLGIVWNLNQKSDVKFLYGRAFRVPTLDELYSVNNPAALGNTSLVPEEIETVEIGLAHRPIAGLQINAGTFHNTFEQIIRLAPTGMPGSFQFENTGEATVWGFEVEARYHWQRENEIYANFTWQHPEDDMTGREIPDVPSYRTNLGLTMRFMDHLKGNANLLYVGERPRALNDPRPDLESYTKMDLTLILENFYKELELRGSIFNLFDEDYAYPAKPGTLYYDYPAAGRTFFLEARYAF